MTERTIRGEHHNEKQAPLFMAFELGLKDWKLWFTIGLGQKARRRTIPARDTEKLRGEIDAAKKRFKLPETAEVLSCYEAGRDGFWLHRYLVESGIKIGI